MSGETVTSRNALQFTNDNKKAYAYSGLLGIDSTETSLLTFNTNSEYIKGTIQVLQGTTSNEDFQYDVYFNDVEGFDTIIDTDNNILQIATSGTTGWTGAGCTLTSDGEALTATLTATGATIEYAGDLNTLEAGRIAFQAQASGGVYIKNIHSYNGGTTDATPYVVNYENATGVPVYTTDYLPVDIPWGSGTWTDVNSSTTSASGTTSIYASGT